MTHHQPHSTTHPLVGIFGEALGLVIALLCLTVFLPLFGFITPAYQLWLPIGLNAVIATAILKTLGFALPAVRTPFSIFAQWVSIYSTYYLLKIYPFNFTAQGMAIVDQILPLCLALTILILAISSIIQGFRWLFLLGSPSAKD